MTSHELSDQVAIVTGGGSGLGRAIAATLAACGAHVVVADINGAAAQRVAGEIAAAGASADAREHDVTRRASCEELAIATLREHGHIDILVNNAGISQTVPFAEMTEEDWDLVNDVNAKGVFLTTRAVVGHMIDRRHGKIVNLSSMVGKEAEALIVHYCASKFAVWGLTQGLAKELAPYDINVNAVCPGIVRTPLWEPKLAELAALKGIEPEEAFQEYVANVPLGRPQEPQDVAEMVAFLSTQRARNITGQAINVCGGQQLH